MGNSRGYKGIGMEGFIARSYDRSARKYSAAMYREWAVGLAQLVPDGGTVLEIAPGPGYLSIELGKRALCTLTALEISGTFVEIARRNAATAGISLEVIQGNASAMPFGSETFDLAFCTSSFKNFSDPIGALEEIRRVLRPGGKAWISDLRRDVTDETIREFVGSTMNLHGFGGLVMRYTFQHSLRPRACTSDEFVAMARQANLTMACVRDNTMDFEVLVEKRAPLT